MSPMTRSIASCAAFAALLAAAPCHAQGWTVLQPQAGANAERVQVVQPGQSAKTFEPPVDTRTKMRNDPGAKSAEAINHSRRYDDGAGTIRRGANGGFSIDFSRY